MKKKMYFIWLNDESTWSKQRVNTLEKEYDLKIEFILLEDKNVIDVLRNLIQDNNEPHLILMDHKLDKIKDTVITTGSTVTEILHKNWPSCPIVCVTAIADIDISIPERSIYDGIFKESNLSSEFATIITIAESFQKLKEKRPQNNKDLIKLLKIPAEIDVSRLLKIIPAELTMHYQDKRLPSIICKWVRNILFERPGFLYDTLWAATLLGINEESFSKVENIFKEACFQGIFSDKTKPRWWQSKIREILYSILIEEGIDSQYPWILGRKLPQITESDCSTCYVCGKDSPEIVAFVDETYKNRQPMHLRCTKTHPAAEQLLFFEEIRIMKV